MTTLRRISYQNICLFDDTDRQSSNPLKDFIFYLKSTGITGLIDFAYSNYLDSLHPKISIKDNLILDAIPKSLIKDNLNNFKQVVSEVKNPYLQNLIHGIGDINTNIKDASPETIKLTSLVKALLSEHEYIFLVNPNEYLSDKYIKVVKSCIKYEVENNLKTVFIKADVKELWCDISTHFITRDKDHFYNKSKNPLHNKTQIKTQYEPTYDFTLIKKTG
jgi:ABC-type sugar transport system ATPase subunit